MNSGTDRDRDGQWDPDSFDPDAAASQDSGIFGLSCPRAGARILLLPVPFEPTVSYAGGAIGGPQAILQASRQVELYDCQTGRPYRHGIHLLAEDPEFLRLSEAAMLLAAPLIRQGGARPGKGDPEVVARIDQLCAQMNGRVETAVRQILASGKLPGVLGGDHSVAYGAIKALAAAHPGLGILQVDAHADLRRAFQGLQWSHASVMENVLRKVGGVGRLVAVGIRDLAEGELRLAAADPRVLIQQDMDWRLQMARGRGFMDLCREAVDALPARVYVSLDIDGLDPSLCPHTGTPVPGGLAFAELCLLLQVVVESGREIVGFDLSEVAPGPEDDEWDGNVAARVLYKLCGFALLSSVSSSGLHPKSS